MPLVIVDYFNYQHAGRCGADYHGNGGAPDPTGLVREMHRGDGDDWPTILVMGEGDQYEFNGGQAGWEAAAAMRAAGAPAYLPLFGSLPREGGPFAPTLFVDPQQIVIRRWYYHRLPDFAARSRNLLIATVPGRTDWFRVIAVHGDIHSEDTRLQDARTFDRLANPTTLIAGDWNTVPSGPHWGPRHLNTSSPATGITPGATESAGSDTSTPPS